MATFYKALYKFNTFLVIFFLATSAFPSFLIFRKYIPMLLPVILYYLLKKNPTFCISNIVKLSFFLGILSIAHYFLGHTSIVGSISFVLIMVTIVSSAALIQDTFVPIYVKVIRLICAISLIIWAFVTLIPGVHSLLISIGNNLPQFFTSDWIEKTSNPGVSLYLYYLPETTDSLYTSFIRNNGPFYEPGLFASYIIIALILNVSRTKKLFHRDNIVLILAVLSTCSSAGYISFAILLLYSISFQKNVLTKIISLVLLALLIQPVMELDFMADKIVSNMQRADQSAASRFGAIMYHIEKIVESPWIGYAGGELPATAFDRFLGGSMENRLSPNGLSYCFVYWGIPLAIVFYILLYRGIKIFLPKNLVLWEYLLIYIIVLTTAFSQTITTEPILLLIASLPLVYEIPRQTFKNRCNPYL